MHVIPDIRKKGLYANQPVIKNPSSPSHQLPKYYQTIRVTCLTIGIGLLVTGVYANIVTFIGNYVVWNIFASRIKQMAGENITIKVRDALLLAVDMNLFCTLFSLLLALMAVIGAILLYISQRMKWRLMEEDEKAELREKLKSEI